MQILMLILLLVKHSLIRTQSHHLDVFSELDCHMYCILQPQANSQTLKKKKSEMNAKDMVKCFNFDDVPAKVKWELTDVYEGTWRPLLNGVDRVPESTEQEWFAAFTYLTLQNSGSLLL